MKHFKCSLYMCFPHKVWLKEWKSYHNKIHDSTNKCKEKYHIDRITPPVTYVYDDNVRHRCCVCKTFRPDALAVNNWNAYHVCLDGGLIRFGYHNTIPTYKCSQDRCDCLIFDDSDLWFVELKMNTTSGLDAQLWKEFKKGMAQLKGSILDLRNKMARKRTPLQCYYCLSHQHSTVCMHRYPLMNTTRNSYLESFRLETGIKVQQLVAIPSSIQ